MNITDVEFRNDVCIINLFVSILKVMVYSYLVLVPKFQSYFDLYQVDTRGHFYVYNRKRTNYVPIL